MVSTQRAKLNDLFNFQGLRKRVTIAPTALPHTDQRPIDDEIKSIDNEYNELDLIDEKFESYVRPTISQSKWIENQKHVRNEINRLGDLVHFYDHKPNLNELEKRIYKRMTRQDRSVQTDKEPETITKPNKNRNRVPVIRLPPPLAMEGVEQFLRENHWRLVDLFRTLDKSKSWAVVKDDFMRLIKEEKLNITDAEAEELITCFCREVHVPLDYKKFARGRSLYKKNMRETLSKTPNSMDTQLESDTSRTTSSNHLQLPTSNVTHNYPTRDTVSSESQLSKSSRSKYKRSSISTLGTDSKFSVYQ